MNQKLLKYPILTKITKYPGTVKPSNNPKTQKHNEPTDNNKKFLRIIPEDLKPLYKNPNPKKIRTVNNIPPISIPANVIKLTL